MKKIIIALSIALVVLSACEKKEIAPAQKSEGIAMTLKANIADNTKATVVAGATGLKTIWDANEKISVITLDASGNLLTVDTFTSSNAAGATSASFSGVFTGDPSNKIRCYYPALAYDEENTDYRSSTGLLYEFKTGSPYFRFSISSTQTGSNATDAVSSAMILRGEATVSDGELNTTLNHFISALKLSADLSAASELATITGVMISSSESVFGSSDWSVASDYEGYENKSAGSVLLHIFTSKIDNPNDLVAYIPTGLSHKSLDVGDTWKISFFGKDASSNKVSYTATKTFSKKPSFAAGVCYPISVSAAELTEDEVPVI